MGQACHIVKYDRQPILGPISCPKIMSYEGMKTYLKADSWKRQCVKRTRWDVDKVWAERMESVKFIYLKVRLFE